MEVDSTLEGEKVQMGIDQTALAHVMGILTNLYSDQEMAVIREYSTNAFDAHIEAGQTRPIEVTLPSALAPFFRVKDFGIGLSADDIRNIYSQYGASTKRESNDVVGMLGLGCKSALTYTDQFTITGVKDGVCTQVSVSREEDGGGSMTIVAQYETDEPNGAEIIVPVKPHNYFERKAATFFRFWEEGTVLVNGKAPVALKGIKLTDKIILSEELDQSVVVMGNVSYPYDDGEYHNYYNRAYTATYVNIGDVNFTPSREALMMTAKTTATIARVKETVKREKQAAFQREIDAQTTPYDALKTMYRVEAIGFESKDATWNGAALPQTFESDDPKKPYSFMVSSSFRGSKPKWESKLYTKSLVRETAVWFEGFTAGMLTPYKRKKLEQWQNEVGVTTPRHWIMTDTIPAEVKKWIDPTLIFDFEAVEAQKLPATGGPRRDGKPSGSYDTIINGLRRNGVQADELDTTKPIYWATKNEYHDPYVEMLNGAEKAGYTLVILGLNRIKKFERDFPMAVRAEDGITKLTEKWMKAITDDDRLYLNVQNGNTDDLCKLDGANINDPELVKIINLAKDKSRKSLVKEYNSFRRFLPDTFLGDWVCPTAKYHLLDSIGYYGYNEKKSVNHITLYINAVYAAGQENN